MFTIVVREYGKVDVQKQVPIVANETLIAYMHQYFQITTAYNDGFMLSIDGVYSQWTGVPVSKRQPIDWFLYLNGKQAPVGAAEVVPQKGDVDLWDYHRWDTSTGGN